MNKHILIIAVVVVVLIIVGIVIGINNHSTAMDALTAQKGEHVYVNYEGRLANGTKFDSSYDHGAPIDFILGAGKVIKGWDDRIVGMKIGEKKTLVIAPADAYGSQDVTDGAGNIIIPANSTLTFNVELVKIGR